MLERSNKENIWNNNKIHNKSQENLKRDLYFFIFGFWKNGFEHAVQISRTTITFKNYTKNIISRFIATKQREKLNNVEYLLGIYLPRDD